MTPEGCRALYTRLTRREREFARLLVSGVTTDSDIARVMGIKPCNAHRYATHLYDKTGMGNRVELALFIVRHPELEALLCQTK